MTKKRVFQTQGESIFRKIKPSKRDEVKFGLNIKRVENDAGRKSSNCFQGLGAVIIKRESPLVRRDRLIEEVLIGKSKDARARTKCLYTYDHQTR